MSTIYFAWVDYSTGGVPAFGPEHQVADEDIVSFRVDHIEGDCATCNIDVRNPKVGLLAPGRPLWAWLSYASDSTAGVTPLFFGRLVGVPTNLLAEVVTLSFVAKPLDFADQKFTLATSLAVLPYYDPLFIDPDKRPQLNTAGDQVGDPDVVLEGYSALWHIDRTTLEMTISDITVGEDGDEIFAASEIPYDSVQIELGQAPLTSVQVIMTAGWSQAATGTIDFGYRWFQCPTGGSIVSSWPRTGQQLAGGWSVVEGYAIDSWNVGGQQAFTKHYTFQNRSKKHTVGDVMSTNLTWTEFPVGGQMFISNVFSQSGSVPAAAVLSYNPGPEKVTTNEFGEMSYTNTQGTSYDPYGAINSQSNWGESEDTAAVPMRISYSQTLVAWWLVNTKLVLGYNAGGKRNETAQFTLAADLQEIVTLPDPTDIVEQLELNGSDVGVPLDGVVPMGDTSINGYFPTERGKLSLEYGILRARSHLLMRARAVNMTWECSFDRAIGLSLRKNAQISDTRIPGGVASGKIIAYSFQASGDTFTMSGSVTIGCSIGHGGTVTTVAGDPDYVETGYVAAGYQTYTGTVSALSSNDVGYSVPVLDPSIGLINPLTKDQVVVTEEVRNPDGYTDWIQVGSDTDREGNTLKTFANFPIMSYYLELLPVDRMNFDNAYDINVTVLNVPKTLDLEAATTL